AEGENATYKIFCNRTIPSGLTGTINFSYTGTAVDGTDYTQVSSVDMLAGDNEVDLIIPILETIGDTGTANTTDLDGQPFGCFQNNGGNYVYYHTLSEN
ncbi:MAG: hypothetical protein ACPG05_03755, partial [Bdellovibrionales bacterium]